MIKSVCTFQGSDVFFVNKEKSLQKLFYQNKRLDRIYSDFPFCNNETKAISQSGKYLITVNTYDSLINLIDASSGNLIRSIDRNRLYHVIPSLDDHDFLLLGGTVPLRLARIDSESAMVKNCRREEWFKTVAKTGRFEISRVEGNRIWIDGSSDFLNLDVEISHFDASSGESSILLKHDMNQISLVRRIDSEVITHVGRGVTHSFRDFTYSADIGEYVLHHPFYKELSTTKGKPLPALFTLDENGCLSRPIHLPADREFWLMKNNGNVIDSNAIEYSVRGGSLTACYDWNEVLG